MIRKAMQSRLFLMLCVGLLLTVLSAMPALARQDDVELDAVYSDDFITFNYPEDWFTCGCPDTHNALAIGNTEEAPNTDDLERDEVQVLVIKSMTIWIDESLDEEMDAETPEEVLEKYFRGEDIETYDFDGREAASMYTENREARLESLFLAVELGNGEIGMLVASARTRDLEQFVDVVFAVGQTLIASEVLDEDNGQQENEEEAGNQDSRNQGLGGRRSREDSESTEENESEAPDLGETFELEDEDFAFSHPEDWQVLENEGTAVLVNDEDVLDIEALSDLKRGDVLVFIYPTVDSLNDYDFPVDDGTRPSTIVSYYASMAMATGFIQDDAMQEPEIGDGDFEASSVLSVLDGEYEQYVLAIENGDGDIITLFAYGAPGELEDFIPTLEMIAATFEVD